jgi:hypothetical protein
MNIINDRIQPLKILNNKQDKRESYVQEHPHL